MVSNSEGVVSNSEGVVSNSKGVVSNSEGVVSNSEGVVSNSEGVVSNSEGVVSNSEGVVSIIRLVGSEYKTVPEAVVPCRRWNSIRISCSGSVKASAEFQLILSLSHNGYM